MGAVGGWAGRWHRVTTLRCAVRCAQRPPLVACRRHLGAPGAPNQLQRFGAQGRGERRVLGTPLGHPSPARPVGATSQGGLAPLPHPCHRGRAAAGRARGRLAPPTTLTGRVASLAAGWLGPSLLAPNVAGSRRKKGLPGLPRARAEVPSHGPASPQGNERHGTAWQAAKRAEAVGKSKRKQREAMASKSMGWKKTERDCPPCSTGSVDSRFRSPLTACDISPQGSGTYMDPPTLSRDSRMENTLRNRCSHISGLLVKTFYDLRALMKSGFCRKVAFSRVWESLSH
jgi:hypothetical protein